MGASVRLEAKAFVDPRFELLGRLMGTSRFDAMGRMACVWAWCTERSRYDIPSFFLAAFFPDDAAAGRIVAAELGEWCECGEPENHPPGCKHLRVKGTETRVEWLTKKREAAAKGGEANKKRLDKPAEEPSGSPSGKPGESLSDSPPSPSPAPSQPTKEILSAAPTSHPLRAEGTGKHNRLATEARKATETVVAAFNAAFERSLSPAGWEDSIRRVLAAGFTEPEMRGVVWWAAREWKEDPKMQKAVTPKTLFKLQSSGGYRTFREYLSCAGERWREEHNGEVPPWERSAVQPKLGVVA